MISFIYDRSKWSMLLLAIDIIFCLRNVIAIAVPGQKNVVLFICDDLRPQMKKAYGQEFMVTPSFDKFAEESLTFDYAFTNFGICSASRNSFMSGRMPDKTRVWNFINHFRQGGMGSGKSPGSDWITLPQFFKEHNYITLGHGKLYHPNHPPKNDEPKSWTQSQKYWPTSNSGCKSPSGEAIRWCPADVPENWISDVNMSGHAMDTLRDVMAPAYKANGTNFFLGIGLHFPHQPWFTPKWSVDLYPPATQLDPPKHPYAPKRVVDVAFTAELDGNPNLSLDESNPILNSSKPISVHGHQNYLCPWPLNGGGGGNGTNNTVPVWFQQQLRMGYYTAVTHSDRLFGKVMDLLESLGLKNDTLVVVTGDHGWQLGEHAEWGKHTNYELAVRVPLLIRAPWKKNVIGKHSSNTFAELIDLYRTMVSLAGISVDDIESDVDGMDLSPVFDDPTAYLKQMAFAQYSRCPGDRYWPKREPGHPAWYMNNCEKVPSANISYMGYSIRSATHRYTEWFPWNGDQCEAVWDQSIGVELYDHTNEKPFPVDHDAFENDNVAEDQPGQVSKHRKLLLAKYKDGNLHSGCPPEPQSHNALHLHRSKVQQDNYLCTIHDCKNDSKFLRIEGYMPPPGTDGIVPMYHLWSSEYTDNFLGTSTNFPKSAYAILSKTNPVGYIFKNKPLSLPNDVTMPLELWYSAEHFDYLNCAREETRQWAKSNNYTFLTTIGFIYTTPDYAHAGLEVY